MTKYNYRRLGEHIFRVRLDKDYDSAFGLIIRYEIQEPTETPRNLWERIKQFFTVKTYHCGYWIPSMSDDSLDERIIWAMNLVVEDLNTQETAEKDWEAL